MTAFLFIVVGLYVSYGVLIPFFPDLVNEDSWLPSSTEFLVLGGVAGVLAGIGASAIGWLLAEEVFRMSYVPALAPVLAAVVLGAAGVVAGGWLGTRGLLARPPLASLRALG